VILRLHALRGAIRRSTSGRNSQATKEAQGIKNKSAGMERHPMSASQRKNKREEREIDEKGGKVSGKSLTSGDETSRVSVGGIDISQKRSLSRAL